ncbi:MAG: hypothetical protein ABIY70_21440 [Capsulimonas sp.]|uniref:hypothetical protein n=1 Tax=Capsulimonas sp. TaxID=2494211 RepID=UPI0032652DA6
MFVRVFASSIALLTLAGASLHAQPYTNPNGFSLEPPAHWTLWEAPDQLSVRWSDSAQKSPNGSILVSVKKLSGVVVPSEALPREAAGVLGTFKKTMSGFTLAATGKTMLSGVPAWYLSATYRLTPKGAVWKIRQVIVVRGRLGATVTYAAPAASFAKAQPVFSKLLASFRFGAVELPTYRSDKGYQLTPATGWTAQLPQVIGGDIHFVEPGVHAYPANLGVHVADVSPPMTIDDLTAHRAQIEAGLAKEAQYVPLENGVETIAGEKALFIIAQLKNPQIDTLLRVRLEFVPHGAKLYRFSALCPDADHAQYEETFKAMIQSVKWTDAK